MRTQPLQATAVRENRRMIRRALLLVGLLALPVIGLMLLQAGVVVACDTRVTADGVAQGHLQWRVTQMSCRHAEPYYDVSIGAEGITLSTALTSQGAPVPVAVSRLDDRTARIALDRARVADGATHVDVKLRRSGSPAERIDLQADVSP